MPWYYMATKDVAACDKPRGAGKQALIRGCPNGATLFCVSRTNRVLRGSAPGEVKHLSSRRKRQPHASYFVRSVLHREYATGTVRSVIPLVVANEPGTAETLFS